MPFTREDIATYEKQAPADVPDDLSAAFGATNSDEAAAVAAAPSPSPATSAPDSAPAASPAPDPATPAASAPDPAAPGGEPSAATPADSATANAAPDDAASTQNGTQPRRGTAQDRIEDLVAERNALRKYIEHREQVWKAPAPPAASAAPTAPAASPTPAAPTTPAPANDPRPSLEQFDYDVAAYNKADGEWLQRQIDRGVESRLSKEREAAMANTAQQQAQAARQAFEDRANKFAAVTPDFPAVVSNPALMQTLQEAPNIVRAFAQSELSAQILYHLGQHMDLTARIARMAPEQQLMAIGRIEGELERAAAPTPSPAPNQQPSKQKVLTQAPPPPTPNAGATTPTKDVNSMSMEEFVAHERAAAIRLREQRRAMRQSR